MINERQVAKRTPRSPSKERERAREIRPPSRGKIGRKWTPASKREIDLRTEINANALRKGIKSNAVRRLKRGPKKATAASSR